MRIISGIHKGKKLFPPKDLAVRPTTDRVKEFVFDYLSDWVIDANVLDLFCGSGAMGIETLSRGAYTCTFVDKENDAISLVHKNLQKVNIDALVMKRSAESFLKTPPLQQYDLIFCDPPYHYDNFEEILHLLKNGFMAKGALLLYESEKRVDGPLVKGVEIIKIKKMGNTKITVYQNNE